MPGEMERVDKFTFMLLIRSVGMVWPRWIALNTAILLTPSAIRNRFIRKGDASDFVDKKELNVIQVENLLDEMALELLPRYC